jgi:hypothetical protein
MNVFGQHYSLNRLIIKWYDLVNKKKSINKLTCWKINNSQFFSNSSMFTDHYIYNEHIYNEHIYEEFISFNTKFINKSKSVSSNKTMISHISKLFILFIIFTTFLCLSSSHDTPTKNVMTIKIVVSLFCLHDLCHHTHTHISV